MNTQDKKDEILLTLDEAVETLSCIAEIPFDREMGGSKNNRLNLDDLKASREISWFYDKDPEISTNIVKQSFRVILDHLKNHYGKDYPHNTNSAAVEGIKTIMLLVGDAAKKLDKFTKLFHKTKQKSILELQEYKELQEFYLNHVAKKIDEGKISQWILGLAKKSSDKKPIHVEQIKKEHIKHVFIELDSVKKDTEYELFFLKKEDGTRFFSPRLIRNIKLVSDFGTYLDENQEDDQFLDIEIWIDKVSSICAKNIIRATRSYFEKFYRYAKQTKDQELVESINKMIIALLMAANTENLSFEPDTKNCQSYFKDFQLFLRSCLKSTDYQRLIAYPPDKSSKLNIAILDLLQQICFVLYTNLSGYQGLLNPIHKTIETSMQNISQDHHVANPYKLWAKLAGNYAAMSKWIKTHKNGPLNKILSVLEEGECHRFDPILQDNLPSQLYTLYIQDMKFQFTRWPSPTCQEFIHKASICEEFKAFLYGCAHQPFFNKILVVNFQDRINWKEYSRSAILEDLPNHESFAKYIDVVTLPKDSEFYHQIAPYHQENRSEIFLENFKSQLQNSKGGFSFPFPFEKEGFGESIIGILEAVHKIFFFEKNILLREERLDFIEIFYVFLQLKIFEVFKADQIAFCCKDGVDISPAAAAQLFVFYKLLSQERLSENDQEHLDLILCGPALINRERLMIPDRFNRMMNALKTIENVREQFGLSGFSKIIQETFGRFYKIPFFKGKMIPQINKDIPSS